MMSQASHNERPIRMAAARCLEGRTLSRRQATTAGKLQLKAELYVEHNRRAAAFQIRIARQSRSPDLVIASHRREATRELKATVGLWVWLLSPFIRALVWALVDAILDELFGSQSGED